MTTHNALRTGLLALAKRSVGIMTACTNKESTNFYLVLPMLGLLGYDFSNPYEVYPSHAAPLTDGTRARVDLAILRDGTPQLAIECQEAGADLTASRSALRLYYDALASVKLGVATNGILFEFFVDSVVPNHMDDEPFLTLDLETISRAGVADEVLDTLISASKSHFDPLTIAEAAHIQLVRKRLRTIFIEESLAPSEGFCRYALDRAGLPNVRASAIERHYAPLVRAAFEESLLLPIVAKLRAEVETEGRAPIAGLHQLGQRIQTAGRELSLLAYVKRRLAFLTADEQQFAAIDDIHAKEYVGRLALYYNREQGGRLMDFIESGDGYHKYIFPDPIGEIVTNSVAEIDGALKAIFDIRLRELGVACGPHRLQRIA